MPDLPPTVTDPDRLPDGQHFQSWEPEAWTWKRTFHVAQEHDQADDGNDGSAASPWKTIQRAADVLEPGDRVVIHAGIYREHVRPARGGAGPDAMVGYEAAPGENVVITGSEAFVGPWQPSDRWKPVASAAPHVWQARLPRDQFVGVHPFASLNIAQENLTRKSFGSFPTQRVVPMMLKRGLVFQDGRRLRQVLEPADMVADDAQGTYFVENDGRWLHVRPFGDGDPRASTWEITTREQALAPDLEGLCYVRVAGLTVRCCANEFPRPQRGAISCGRGTHWVIEHCHVEHINSVGIDVSYGGHPHLVEHGQGSDCIVRGCHVRDCGLIGIAATGHPMYRLLMEDNVIRDCGWHRVERVWENAGIKCHNARDSMFRRNIIVGCRDASGLWLDWDIRNTRVWGNVILDTQSAFGGVFIEAAKHQRTEIDHNVIVGSRQVPPLQAAAGDAPSAGGHGIYEHDSDRMDVHHNLIAHCEGAGVCLRLGQVDRIAAGRGATCRGHEVHRNLMVDCTQFIQLGRANDNAAAGNVYAGGGSAPFVITEPREHLDLDSWAEFHGFDRDAATPRAAVALNLAEHNGVLKITLDLTLGERWSDLATPAPGPWPDLPPGQHRLTR